MGKGGVVFRVDGSRDLGLGHIVRSMNVARALREEAAHESREIPIVFVARDDEGARYAVKGSGFEGLIKWIPWDGDEIGRFGEILDDLEPRVVVTDIDLRGRVDEYLAILYPHSAHVSLHEHNYPLLQGDTLIAPTIRPLQMAKGGTPGVTHFTGADYILLPPDIVERRKHAPVPKYPPETGVVSMGGGDPSRLTHEVAAAIRAYNNPAVLWKVVLGSASGYDRWVFAREYPGGIEFIPGTELSRDDFLDLLASADLAVVNGGTTLYEALALGRPSIAVAQNDFEDAVVRILAEAGAVVAVTESSRAAILDMLSDLMGNPEKLESIGRTGASMIDGKGSRRAARLIKAHLH